MQLERETALSIHFEYVSGNGIAGSYGNSVLNFDELHYFPQ